MRKLILATLTTLCPMWAATNNVTATAVWRVWTTGAAANGGCFDPANQGATGIDYSKQSSAQFVSTADLSTSGAGATTITATTSPWTNAVPGNCVHITAGTNFTQGFYVVTGFINANNITLNVSPTPAAAGSAGTGAIGGAVSTITTAQTGVVAGNSVYIKGPYTITTGGLNFATAGASGAPISWIGYTASDTDGGPALLQTSGGSSI